MAIDIGTQVHAAAERKRLLEELKNAQDNLRAANQDAQRAERTISEKRQRGAQLHAVLSRKPNGLKAQCPEADELRKVVAEEAEAQHERDLADVAQEGAARAVQAVKQELDTLLYKHMNAFLADQAEREAKLPAKFKQLQSWYRACEKLWAEIAAEYQVLGPALADRLKDADNERGVWPDPGTYERAVRPKPFPLPPSSELANISPRPSGVDRFREQNK